MKNFIQLLKKSYLQWKRSKEAVKISQFAESVEMLDAYYDFQEAMQEGEE